jgi:hypothetical protein
MEHWDAKDKALAILALLVVVLGCLNFITWLESRALRQEIHRLEQRPLWVPGGVGGARPQ